MKPQFSIVIPTRERHETLGYALKTCLSQTFDDYEIIVCDNFSSPATKAVVDQFSSSKIRYFRTSEPLSMVRNWEFAISQTRGEYITVIGDDDGLLFHALGTVEKVIKLTDAKAVRWEWANYYWPELSLGDSELEKTWQNYLQIPFIRDNQIYQGDEIISRVLQGAEDYRQLPMIYNSMIHRDLLETLQKKTGRLFQSCAPDLYSGIAIAYLCDRYASIGTPLGIAGISKKSNGTLTLHSKESSKAEVVSEFKTLSNQDGLPFHPSIPEVKAFAAAFAESFCHAKDHLFPDDPKLILHKKTLAKQCVEQLYVHTEAEWHESLVRIRASLSHDSTLQAWFDQQYGLITPALNRSYLEQGWQKGFNGKDLLLDAAEFGVRDVYGVAELCQKLLNLNPQTLGEVFEQNCIYTQLKITQTATEVFQKAAEDRLQAINRLNAGLQERQDSIEKLQTRVKDLKDKHTNTKEQLDNALIEIEKIKASRFWKLRNQWFKLKSQLGFK